MAIKSLQLKTFTEKWLYILKKIFFRKYIYILKDVRKMHGCLKHIFLRKTISSCSVYNYLIVTKQYLRKSIYIGKIFLYKVVTFKL